MGKTPNTVSVNGADMERSFFEDNVAEAKALDWRPSAPTSIEDHVHCIVCVKALRSMSLSMVDPLGHRYVCRYCFEHYVSD